MEKSIPIIPDLDVTLVVVEGETLESETILALSNERRETIIKKVEEIIDREAEIARKDENATHCNADAYFELSKICKNQNELVYAIVTWEHAMQELSNPFAGLMSALNASRQ